MSRLRVGTPIRIAGRTIVPVERVWGTSDTGKHRFWVWSAKEPLAVVVCEPSQQQAFDTSGSPIPLESLLREVPGLRATLAKL